jgi:hypothetical protein
MKSRGSDKGLSEHNYTTVYSTLFAHLVGQPGVNMFELGIGTNNPGLPSTMGINGVPGASLRGWRDWFKTAEIYGADIDKNILFTDDRIKTYYVDQRDSVSVKDLWKNIGDDVQFDVIIDDGLHEFSANDAFVRNSIHKLKPGGIYVIEDVHHTGLDKFRSAGIEYSRIFKCDVQIVMLPYEFNDSNNTLMLLRPVPVPGGVDRVNTGRV